MDTPNVPQKMPSVVILSEAKNLSSI